MAERTIIIQVPFPKLPSALVSRFSNFYFLSHHELPGKCYPQLFILWD
jgi:hypothetical protein